MVKNEDLGFWTQSEITVVSRYDGVIEYCNHAGAYEEVEYHQSMNPAGDVIEWPAKVMLCDKCPAWRMPESNEWEDAPFEGERYA